jgi:ribosome-associated protein
VPVSLAPNLKDGPPMEESPGLDVDGLLSIPRAELTYRATRSGGPGGQHVNTSSTRVELEWDVAGSPSLAEAQRERILAKLATRISGEGVLRLAASDSRSQHRNREAVTARLVELVGEALRVPKARKRTRKPRRATEARLKAKRTRSEVKRGRGPVTGEE